MTKKLIKKQKTTCRDELTKQDHDEGTAKRVQPHYPLSNNKKTTNVTIKKKLYLVLKNEPHTHRERKNHIIKTPSWRLFLHTQMTHRGANAL